jgi:uncharacterized protein (DUF305 family)
MNRAFGFAIIAALAGVLATGCADTQPMGMGGRGGSMMGAADASPSQQMHRSMMGGMQQMQGMQLTGDPDKDFIRMMRMHHLQGMEMARIEVQRGRDAEAKRMAQKIIDEQGKEVAEFDRWLSRNQ